MYKWLALVEESRAKQYSLLNERLQLLLPIFQEINTKVYQETWELLLVEIA